MKNTEGNVRRGKKTFDLSCQRGNSALRISDQKKDQQLNNSWLLSARGVRGFQNRVHIDI